MPFRFAGNADEVAPQLRVDMQNLNAFDAAGLREFADLIVRFLLAPGSTDLLASVDAFAAARGINRAALKNSVRGALVVFKGALKHNVNAEALRDDCVGLGMAEASADTIAALWSEHQRELSQSVVTQTLMVNELVDLEWKFGVTASSSECAQVGSTFLQLKLVVDKGGGVREDVYMELSLDQFYNFLAQMEKAKQHVDFLSSASASASSSS